MYGIIFTQVSKRQPLPTDSYLLAPSFSSHARQCAAMATIDENPEECWPHAGKENHRVSSLRRQLESHVLYSMKLHHFVRHRLAQNISTNNNLHCASSTIYYTDKFYLVSLQWRNYPTHLNVYDQSEKQIPVKRPWSNFSQSLRNKSTFFASVDCHC